MSEIFSKLLREKYATGEGGGSAKGPKLTYGREEVIIRSGSGGIIEIVVPALKIYPDGSKKIGVHTGNTIRDVCSK